AKPAIAVGRQVKGACERNVVAGTRSAIDLDQATDAIAANTAANQAVAVCIAGYAIGLEVGSPGDADECVAPFRKHVDLATQPVTAVDGEIVEAAHAARVDVQVAEDPHGGICRSIDLDQA